MRKARGNVTGIGCSLIVLKVTSDAGGAGQVVIVVHVAIGALAGWNRVRPSQRESGAVVIERRIQPGGRVVALITALRKVRRDVIGIRGSLVILQVAADAGRGGQVVVVVDVAIGALPRRNCMHAGQGEGCEGVIE